jgi:enediyne biosynthesis protein E4
VCIAVRARRWGAARRGALWIAGICPAISSTFAMERQMTTEAKTRCSRTALSIGTAVAGAVALLASAVARTPAAPIRFENVSARSGLTFVLDQYATPEKHMVETMAGGLAVFDYDGDGLPDIYFTNGASIPSLRKETPAQWNRLFRNDGGMTFSDVTVRAGVQASGYTTGAAAADFDNDGRIDLFVAGVQRNQLFRNLGDGRFEDVTARSGIQSYTWSVAAGWFDYDNDGWLDLFVVNYVDWTPETNKYCGDRARDIRVYCHPRQYAGLPNALYRNRRDGTFEDVSAASGIARHVGKGMSVAFADADADGFTDVFVTNDAVSDFLFRNRGDGTFDEVGLLAGVAAPAHGRPTSSMGVDFRDFDNDGRPDLNVTALTGETFPLFKNDNGRFFRDVTYASGLGVSSIRRSGWGNALADFDNDGFKDLVTANSHANDRIEEFESATYRQPNAIWRNVQGRFEDVSAGAGADFGVSRAHRGIGVGDFDGDGRLDLVVSVLGDRPVLLRNSSEPTHAWSVLRLVGSASNRDGIGARVHLDSQWNHMTTAVGYASSSDYGVHFGLGTRKVIERILIRWPSGVSQTIENAPVNRVLTVQETGSSGALAR